MKPSRTAVDLYWIPLGAGGHCVRFNGRVFEAIEAARQHRQPCDLYHAALVVELDGDRYTIEIAPSPNADEASRGVVATGPVGSRYAGRLRLFRYEIRCWRGGSIPDLDWAVGGPRRLTSDPATARRLLDFIATVPTPVWGRDELKAGEMWNSNSMIAWLIATAGLSTDLLRPPPRGRAPGWDAGLEVARRSGAYERDMPRLSCKEPQHFSSLMGGGGPPGTLSRSSPRGRWGGSPMPARVLQAMLAGSQGERGPMRRAAQAATIGFAALMVFQAALAAGAPLGDAAWGGAHAHLTTAERVGSAISVFIYLAAMLVARGRAAGREERRYRWGIWALAALLGIAGVMNLASESRWENLLLAPVGVVLAALCLVVARGATTARRRAADGRPTLLTSAH
jgi:hypothetical protein